MDPATTLLATPLIKAFEGCRLNAYQDGAGVWTIGYGHTGPEVVPGLTWTQEQAEAALVEDLSRAYTQLAHISAPDLWSPGRKAALTDFVYNLGIGTYRSSTLRKEADAGNWEGVKTELAKWVHAGGQVEEGLVRRRQAEIALIDA